MKALLRSKHLQTHGAFDREYDTVARRIDPTLVGAGPRKAQFYRWLSGTVSGRPYPHHCRVLEGMFPGYTADQLFTEYAGLPDGPRELTSADLCDSSGRGPVAFASRTELLRAYPPSELFTGARSIDLLGISLNLLCQQYPDSAIDALLRAGAAIRCLFLDPFGRYTTEREADEDQSPGALAALTGLNIATLQRIGQRSAELGAPGILSIRTYDQPVRFNITTADGICVFQPYLPAVRGIESPAFVVRAGDGIFEAFVESFEAIWARGKDLRDAS